LLFTENDGLVAKLGGFGWAQSAEKSNWRRSSECVVGTPPYLDPCYLQSGQYTMGADVFSLGVVLLEVLLGKSATRARGKNLHSDTSADDSFATRRLRDDPLSAAVRQWMDTSESRMPALAQALKRSPAHGQRQNALATSWQEDALDDVTGLLASMLQLCDDYSSQAGNQIPHDSLAVCELQRCRPTMVEVEHVLSSSLTKQSSLETRRGQRSCTVCMDAFTDARLQPCGHAVLCQACAAELLGRCDPCPICRAAITGYSAGEFHHTFAP